METQRYSKMVQQVKEYILEAVKAYERQPEDYGTDLDFALALNQRVLDGILTCEDPVYEAIFQQKKSSIISLWWELFLIIKEKRCETIQIVNF